MAAHHMSQGGVEGGPLAISPSQASSLNMVLTRQLHEGSSQK